MKRCKDCGAYLDAGEKCDCGGKPAPPPKPPKKNTNTARIERAMKEWVYR